MGADLVGNSAQNNKDDSRAREQSQVPHNKEDFWIAGGSKWLSDVEETLRSHVDGGRRAELRHAKASNHKHRGFRVSGQSDTLP